MEENLYGSALQSFRAADCGQKMRLRQKQAVEFKKEAGLITGASIINMTLSELFVVDWPTKCDSNNDETEAGGHK